METWHDSLSGVDANIQVGTNNSRDRNGSAKIGKRVDALARPRQGRRIRPDKIRNKIHDRRLVQSIKHVRPKLGLGILETKDTALVQLGKREGSLGVDILVKG